MGNKSESTVPPPRPEGNKANHTKNKKKETIPRQIHRVRRRPKGKGWKTEGQQKHPPGSLSSLWYD